MIHTYLDETIRFEIKYKTQQSSMRMTMDHYGNIEVQAPKGTPHDEIIHLLEKNWELLQMKIKETEDRWNGPQEKSYEHGESFLYLGKSYPIKVVHDQKIEKDYVNFDQNQLQIHVKLPDDERPKQALKRFYYQQCKALVEASITEYQHNFKSKPRSIRITDSPTTWGTCDSKLQLTFNWKLAMAPQKVINYVVVHEMCHMLHLNHDRSFWRLVGKIMPDYKEQERWLALSNWKMTV
ncbi:M48 family metallopeptidase [Bacillus sp. AK128]